MILTNTQKLKLLQKYFGKSNAGTHEAAFYCPICKEGRKDKMKLAIRLSDGYHHCWVCEFSGRSFYMLFKKLAPAGLHDPLCEPLFDSYQKQEHVVVSQEDADPVKLPKELFLVGMGDTRDPYITSVRNYLLGRGLTINDMLRWRIAATKSGPLKRKAIIPSFNADGEPNYYVARTIDDSMFKYNNCKRPKTEIIFNEIDIDWKKPVMLVEGVFDAIMCPENTIPVLGSALPKESVLFKKLWENKCQVTVAFDPDLKDKSHRVCESLSKAGLDVMQVWAPDGKDFGSMSKKDVKQVLQSSKVWMKEDRLFFKIRNINSGSLF